MVNSILKDINPLENERPTLYADRVGQLYISSISKEQRDMLGQYFTPAVIADFMSSLINCNLKCIDILDPGAGIGVLSCSLIERIIQLPNKPEKIKLIAYECDKKLLPILKKCLDYTRYWSKNHGVILEYKVIKSDYILSNANALEKIKTLTNNGKTRFDIVISNPPYFKISKSDERAQISRSIIYGQPNIYSIFMAVSASLLKESGQLIFITPRSFAAGSYFQLFREKFFSIVRPTHLHLFGSRQKAFDRDAILQENIIIKAIRDKNWEKSDKGYTVNISSSHGLGDLNYNNGRVVPLKEIIDMSSKNKFLHIPLSDKDDSVVQLVNSWDGSLHKYNMEISTGPVVPFRVKGLIGDTGNINTTHAPLLWMQNINEMSVQWPVSSKNNQYIIISSSSKKLLVDNKNYILMRRFSPKEDYKRLKTAPYLAGSINTKYLGLENHLNYIYRPNGELTKGEIFGLSAVLNSKIIDSYIRTFNGNTEISATELRSIPLPPLKTIIDIGNYLLENALSNGDIDRFVIDKLFKNNKLYVKDQKAAIYG